MKERHFAPYAETGEVVGSVDVESSASPTCSTADTVTIPKERYRALMAELRELRSDASEQSRRIARIMGELTEYLTSR